MRIFTLFDVPEDLTAYASQIPATDMLDISHGLALIVILRCPHCRDGWGIHWSRGEINFRRHLMGNDCRGRGKAKSEPAGPQLSCETRVVKIY